MRITGEGNKEGYDFPEVISRFKRYSEYEIVVIPNPIPLNKRIELEGIVPPLDYIEVIRPVDGSKVEEYTPEDEAARILTEFVKLEDIDNKAILRFSKAYGLLGMTHNYPELAKYFDEEMGEPIIHIIDRAREVACLLKINQAITQKDFLTLKNFVKPIFTTDKTGERQLIDFVVDEGRERESIFLNTDGSIKKGKGKSMVSVFYLSPPFEKITEESYYYAASVYIAQNINEKLRGNAEVGVSVGKTKNDYIFIPGTRLPSLQTFIYWQFRGLVTGIDKLRKCIYCGAYFLPKTERQTSCPAIGYESKAPCKNRANVAAWTREQKKKSKGVNQ